MAPRLSLNLVMISIAAVSVVHSAPDNLRQSCKNFDPWKDLGKCVMPFELETAAEGLCQRHRLHEGLGVWNQSGSRNPSGIISTTLRQGSFRTLWNRNRNLEPVYPVLPYYYYRYRSGGNNARRAKRDMFSDASVATPWTSIKTSCGHCAIMTRCRTREPQFGCSPSLEVQRAPCSIPSGSDGIKPCVVDPNVCVNISSSHQTSFATILSEAEAKQAADKAAAAPTTIRRSLFHSWETFKVREKRAAPSLSVATYLRKLPKLNCVRSSVTLACECCCKPYVPVAGECKEGIFV